MDSDFVILTEYVGKGKISAGRQARGHSGIVNSPALPAGYAYKWSGEYEFELRAKARLKLILPVVFLAIFVLLFMVFHSVTEAAVLIFPIIYGLTGGLILQWWLGYNFNVAVWVGYITLFGIAVETGVVMVFTARVVGRRGLPHQKLPAFLASII